MESRQTLIVVGGLLAAGVVVSFALSKLLGDSTPAADAKVLAKAARDEPQTKEREHDGARARDRDGAAKKDDPKAPQPVVEKETAPVPAVRRSGPELREAAERDLHLEDLPRLPEAFEKEMVDLHGEIYELWGLMEGSTDDEFAAQFHEAQGRLERIYEKVGEDADAKQALSERDTKMREMMAKRMPH